MNLMGIFGASDDGAARPLPTVFLLRGGSVALMRARRPGWLSGQRSRSGILHFREQRANPAFRRTIALHQELHCKFLKELVEGWLVAALIAQDFLLGQFLARQ
jgi:hypothetical protein